MARRLAAVPDTPRRVAAYVRVSALMGRGGDDFHSPDVQLGAIRRATAGMAEVAVVEDIDQSGTNFSRAGIDKVRAMAQAGLIDAVAVFKVDRFGRDVLESLLELRDLAKSGVTIISASEHIDTSTPAGEMMLINMLNIAQYQAKEIGRGWSTAIARRAELGKHHGRPLGYRKADKRMLPDPVLGPAVTEVFRRYASGEPIGEVTRYLAAVRARPMITANVKKLLRNPVYRGYVITAGQTLPGEHEPLVDEVTWRRVQDRLAAEAGTPPRHLAPTWSLVGLCECPAGHKLQRQPVKRKGGWWEDRLVCGMGRGQVHQRCPGVGYPVLERVEAETLRQVADYAGKLRSDHASRAARLAKAATTRADRSTLERQLTDTRKAMVRLTTQWSLMQIPDEVYRESMADLRRAETAAAAELARIGPDTEFDPVKTAGLVETLLALWPEMTHAERGKALRSVVERIVVRKSDYWREPESDRVRVDFRW